MTYRRLRVLILGRDAARRRTLREALLCAAAPAPAAADPEDEVRILEVERAGEIVPRPRPEFDVALLCLAPGDDAEGLSRDAAAHLPHLPLISVGDDLRPDAEALVACGVEDHVPVACFACAGHPRLRAAIRWAIERRELLEKVERLHRECEERSLHDPLTGLANRILVRDRLKHLLARSQRDRNGFALLFVDLDGFKPINDELGHAAGDELLSAVDTCARWGGDEFLLLLEGAGGAAGAERVAADVLAALTPPLRVAGRRIGIRASVGISTCPEHGRDADALIRAADAAMYAAKAAGGGRLCHAGAQPGGTPVEGAPAGGASV
jgi:diguanylate cyclase (GGDEF)-like protein